MSPHIASSPGNAIQLQLHNVFKITLIKEIWNRIICNRPKHNVISLSGPLCTHFLIYIKNGDM